MMLLSPDGYCPHFFCHDVRQMFVSTAIGCHPRYLLVQVRAVFIASAAAFSNIFLTFVVVVVLFFLFVCLFIDLHHRPLSGLRFGISVHVLGL